MSRRQAIRRVNGVVTRGTQGACIGGAVESGRFGGGLRAELAHTRHGWDDGGDGVYFGGWVKNCLGVGEWEMW